MSKAIRRATFEDLPAILPLVKGTARFHMEGRKDMFRENASPKPERNLENALKNEKSAVFVSLSEGGGITGVLLSALKESHSHLVMRDSRTLWVDELAVLEEHRREGYGKLLMEAAVSFAREMGCARVELNVWAFNEGAREFYRGLGLRDQRVVMEMIL